MYKLVGILFGGAVSVVNLLAGSAVLALAVHPGVGDGFVLHVALLVVEAADAVAAVGCLAAIEGAAAQQRGQLRQGHAKHLTMHDVVDALLPIGYLVVEAAVQPLYDFAQKDAAFAGRIKKGRRWIAKEFLRQEIQHLVRDFRRREHLVI